MESFSKYFTQTDVRAEEFFLSLRNTEVVEFFSWVTLLGSWQAILVGAIFATGIFVLFGRRKYILPFWIVLAGSMALSSVSKFAFARERPSSALFAEYGFSFPSLHATIAVAFYGFLAYVLVREIHKRAREWTIVIAAVLIIAAIGLSRLFLGVHYVSDILIGYLSGLLMLGIGIALAERSAKHRFSKKS